MKNDQRRKRTRDAGPVQEGEVRLPWPVSLLDRVSDAVVSTDLQLRITSWNKAAEGIYGWSAKDAIGRQIDELLQTRFISTTAEATFAYLLEKGHVEMTLLHRDRAGRERWVEARITLTRDAQGRPLYTQGVLRDITARKAAEERLRESESRFRALVTATADAIYRVSADGTEMLFLRGNGFVPDTDSPDRTWLQKYIPAEDHAQVLHTVGQALAARSASQMEHRVFRQDGSVGWAHSRAIPIVNAQGEITEWFGVASDITARKEAEAVLLRSKEDLEKLVAERTAKLQQTMLQLQAQRQRLFAVLETLPAMICLLSPKFEVVFANRAFRERFGETRGRRCYEQCFGRNEPCETCDSLIPLKTRQPHHFEATLPNGSIFSAHAFPFTDADGTPLVLEMNVDITEFRKTQAALQDSVEELSHFSHSITHDMRTPLRTAAGLLDILKDNLGRSLSPKNRDLLQRIQTATSRMDRLITDALQYSRAGKADMPMEKVNVRALLEGIVQSYPQMQPPQARIEIAEDLPAVLANEAGLTQCFSNLLGNAVKFVAPGTIPRVRIYAAPNTSGKKNAAKRNKKPRAAAPPAHPPPPAGFVRISIQDNGVGIPAQAREKMFRLFQRARSQYEGTGLGLALAKKVTERMGGRIGFDSAEGQGSVFWVELRQA